MKVFTLVLSTLLLAGCSRKATITISGDTNAVVVVEDTTPIAQPAPKQEPTWYVFKIKEFKSVTHSEDRSWAMIEGVTMQGKEFKIKVVWDGVFKDSHPKALDGWIKMPKAEFEANVPYVIAGKVLSREPLTIQPDTMAKKAPDFGAPAESVY